MNKRKIMNGGKKRTQFGGPKERKARRACQKAPMASIMVVFALTSPTKAQARIIPRTKVEERTKQEKARKELILNLDSQPQKHPMKKDMASDDWSASHWTDDSWTSDAGRFYTKSHTAWMVAPPLNLANHPTHVVLDLGCTRSIGSRAAIERFKKHAWYYGVTTEFCPCHESFVFANSETETCKERCIIHFPTTAPFSTKGDVLETCDVHILFSLSLR